MPYRGEDLDMQLALALSAAEGKFQQNETNKDREADQNGVADPATSQKQGQNKNKSDANKGDSKKNNEEIPPLSLDEEVALAMSMQVDEDDQFLAQLAATEDESITVKHDWLKSSETTTPVVEEEEWNKDHRLALAQARQEDEEFANSTITGRAWKFVRSIFEEHERIVSCKESNTGLAPDLHFETIGVDDMMDTTERFMEALEACHLEGHKDTQIDIGYHFTKSENLENIKTNGLLTKAERMEKGVAQNFNGSAWGDGVYTGNNPFAFANFGDAGLLVCRFKGKTNPAVRGGAGFCGDTAIAGRGTDSEMVVLLKSHQCIPLLKFKRMHKSDEEVDQAIWNAHIRLQSIVDTFFNNGAKTRVSLVRRPLRYQVHATATPVPRSGVYVRAIGKKFRRASRTLACASRSQSMAPAPSSTPSAAAHGDMAAPKIGQGESLGDAESVDSTAAIPGNQGNLTKPQRRSVPSESPVDALESWYEKWKKRRVVVDDGPPRALKHSPCVSETYRRRDNGDNTNTVNSPFEEVMRVMQYSKEKLICENAATLVVVYSFKVPDGIFSHSKLCHRLEYLPDGSSEGLALLERLKYAFCDGVLKTETWDLIPHRTSPYLSYKNHLVDCREALDAMGVPSADDCDCSSFLVKAKGAREKDEDEAPCKAEAAATTTTDPEQCAIDVE